MLFEDSSSVLYTLSKAGGVWNRVQIYVLELGTETKKYGK